MKPERKREERPTPSATLERMGPGRRSSAPRCTSSAGRRYTGAYTLSARAKAPGATEAACPAHDCPGWMK